MSQTRTYRFLVRNSSGAQTWVHLQGENPHLAMELARAIYGANLLSEGASLVN